VHTCKPLYVGICDAVFDDMSNHNGLDFDAAGLSFVKILIIDLDRCWHPAFLSYVQVRLTIATQPVLKPPLPRDFKEIYPWPALGFPGDAASCNICHKA
jgi:hypothetical protein